MPAQPSSSNTSPRTTYLRSKGRHRWGARVEEGQPGDSYARLAQLQQHQSQDYTAEQEREQHKGTKNSIRKGPARMFLRHPAQLQQHQSQDNIAGQGRDQSLVRWQNIASQEIPTPAQPSSSSTSPRTTQLQEREQYGSAIAIKKGPARRYLHPPQPSSSSTNPRTT